MVTCELKHYCDSYLHLQADVTIRATVCSKLQMIAEQVHFLQQQAHKVLLEAKENLKLHHAACNFRKLPGHIYHLYERPSGQQYFSMLSPEVGYAHSAALCIVLLVGEGDSDVVKEQSARELGTHHTQRRNGLVMPTMSLGLLVDV
jgi:hypothetical protein